MTCVLFNLIDEFNVTTLGGDNPNVNKTIEPLIDKELIANRKKQ